MDPWTAQADEVYTAQYIVILFHHSCLLLISQLRLEQKVEDRSPMSRSIFSITE